MAVYSYEGRGEGCQEEVNVDVHHRFSPFFLPSRTLFFPLLLCARHTTHHCSTVMTILFARLRRFTTLGHVDGPQVVVYL